MDPLERAITNLRGQRSLLEVERADCVKERQMTTSRGRAQHLDHLIDKIDHKIEAIDYALSFLENPEEE